MVFTFGTLQTTCFEKLAYFVTEISNSIQKLQTFISILRNISPPLDPVLPEQG